MRTLKLAVVCTALCIAMAVGAQAALALEGAASGDSLLSSSLVVPAAQDLLGGQQLTDRRAAERANPVKIEERKASRTRFEHLGAQAAIELAGEKFPSIVHRPDGGLPSLPAGEQIESYVGANVARVSLPGSKQGAIESLEPIAVPTGNGHFKPIDLALKQSSEGYAPSVGNVGVKIPSRLSLGVGIPAEGVTLTPVESSGQSLGGTQGTVDGASVLYTNTETDTDTLVKPTTTGAQVDALLRSENSPEALYYRVGMPAGAKLIADRRRHGARVVLEGRTIAVVSAPSAQDSAGTSVPMRTAVTGDTLDVTVARGSREYQYPIEVDPWVEDTALGAPGSSATNWIFSGSGNSEAYYSGVSIVLNEEGSYGEERDALVYKAYGLANVFSIEEESEAGVSEVSGAITKLEIAYGASEENGQVLAGAGQSYGRSYFHLCVARGAVNCGEGTIHEGNAVIFSQTSTKSGPAEDGFWAELYEAKMGVQQPTGTTHAEFNTNTPSLTSDGGRQNVLYGSQGWLGEHNGGFEIITKDEGVGVSNAQISDSSAHASWGFDEPIYGEKLCKGIWCQQEFSYHVNYASGMVEGENLLEVCASDVIGYSNCRKATLDVDNTKPREIKLKGIAEEGAELSASPHQITVEATDGTTPTPSSGIKSIAVLVDGVEVGSPAGGCSPGECTASGTWTISGEKLGTGEHKLSVKATDNANNVLETKYTFAIRNATPQQMGPGTVDPVTGQLALNATDVDQAGLSSVARAYLSRALSAGTEGPLGPQWTLSVGASQTLNVLPNGNVEMRAASGASTTFASKGVSGGKGSFTAPKGDENWELESLEKVVGKGITEYLLKNPTAGVTDTFTLPSGSRLWVMTVSEGAAPSETTRYGYQTAEAGTEHPVTEPTEVLGPVPAGVTCGKNPQEVKLEELKAGCRALTFAYSATGSGGENSSNWGQYKGRLATVSLTAYEPGPKAMKTVAVAQYGYDAEGRLRTEWDPRISPLLKMTYGYDSEGHVTAVSPPGLEPWLIRYGAIVGDSGTGRVLSVTRPLASVALGSGSRPVNTVRPTLSTTNPIIGTTIKVSANGTWSNSPLAYSYQWQDCNSVGEKCTAIVGAVNQSYTPQASDAGYALVAQVIAQNSTEAAKAPTAASKVVPISAPSFSNYYANGGATTSPTHVTVAANGNFWVSDTPNNRLEEFSSAGTFIEAIGWGVTNNEAKFQICVSSCHVGIKGAGAGQFSNPGGVVASQNTGMLYVADTSNGRIQEFEESGKFVRSFASKGTGPGQLGTPGGVTLDARENLWVTDTANSRIEEYSPTGTFMYEFGNYGTGNGGLWDPVDITFSGGNLYVAEGGIAGTGNSRVQEFTTAGTYLNQWGKKGTGEGEYEFQGITGIATEPASGDLYVVDCTKNRVLAFNPAGSYIAKFGSVGTEAGKFSCPDGIAFDSSRNAYVVDCNNSRVQKWVPTYSTSNPVPAPPAEGSNAIQTIEYRVPVSGSGAPYQMTSTELAKWAQTSDLPKEATAIFPPDEPMGWPAADYKRASLIYMDGQARIVNTANPSGGISTVEYNALNEMTRELSAANRATALKEGSKSVEVAEALSSKKVYNPEGTQLLETYGPEHKIVVPGGGEEETRDHEKFSYNEGAPSGHYNLVTKSESWTETTASKKVLEKHEKKTSYNGGGWGLREPTLVSTEIKGQRTTNQTAYNATTGEPVETTTSVSTGTPIYASQFGSSGSGSGQFKSPSAGALDSHGNLWVADKGNNRVEEFTAFGQFIAAFGSEGTGALQFKAPEGIAVNQSNGNVYVTDSANNRVEIISTEGKFIATYGFGVSNGEPVFQTCTASCHAGLSGSGNGQFNHPVGVAVDASGNVWVVDRGNNRIEKLSSENAYLAKYGSSGTGELQFKEPSYMAISAGNLYVTDSGNARVEELSASGAYVSQFGSSGSEGGQFGKPDGIAANPNTGRLYVGDPTNSRIEEFTESGFYSAQFGVLGSGAGQLKEPAGLVADKAGDIDVMDSGNSRVESWERPSPAPVFASQFGNGDFAFAVGDAADAKGNLWVANAYGNNIQEFSASGTRLGTFATWGSGSNQVKEPLGVAVDRSTGSIYVGDTQNDRIDIFNEKGEFTGAFGYGVNNGEEKLQVCTTACKAGLGGAHSGEFNSPGWVAVDASSDIWVTDESNNRVDEFNSKDEFVRAFGFGVSNGKSEFEICTSSCQTGLGGSGAGQFSNPTGIAVVGTHVYVSDLFNNRVEMFSNEGGYIGQFGSAGTGNGQFNHPVGIAADASGNLYVSDKHNNRIEEFTASGAYIRTIASKGAGNSQIDEVEGVAIDSSGDLYMVDSENNRLEKWALAPNPGNEGAENSKTIYYTAAANAEYANCGGHPEWANLVCQTEPAVQPGDSGPPGLPVTTTTYNVWDEPETVVEKIGSVTRTIKKSVDTGGRELFSEETTTSAEDAPLTKVSFEYNSETGALERQFEGGSTITRLYNKLGRLTTYTDASVGTTKYVYDIDGRTEEVSERKGRQVYSYDPTSGLMTKLFDTAAGTFTASYDVAGNMLTEGYPNGMSAKYGYNAIGQTTKLEYEKTTHCSEKCVWFSDTRAFEANGRPASQVSTLGSEGYVYDGTGNLVETKETPTGKGCQARLYGYNEENGQRESMISREPNEKGECTTEGGVAEGHFYDAVGRVIDPGVSYDPLGNMTKVPSVDAGGSSITSSFYVDNQVATQQQGEKTIEYSYDPDGRTMVSKLKGPSGTVTSIDHYAGDGNSLVWTCEESGFGECKEESETKWTRNIPGIDGQLDAVQTKGETPVLQLHDLQGNTVATAALSETGTGLLSSQNVTEFGVQTGSPVKYSWLGAAGETSELGTGVITDAGETYVPQMAQTLQTEAPIPPGSTGGDAHLNQTALTETDVEAVNAGAARTIQEQRELEVAAEIAADGEGTDPTYYYTRRQAANLGRKLDGLTSFGEYLDVVLGLPDGIIGFIEGALAGKIDKVDSSINWFKDAGDGLLQCSEETAAVCEFSFKEFKLKTPEVKLFDPFTFKVETISEFKITLINPLSPAIVSWCLGPTVTNHQGCYQIGKKRHGPEYQEA